MATKTATQPTRRSGIYSNRCHGQDINIVLAFSTHGDDIKKKCNRTKEKKKRKRHQLIWDWIIYDLVYVASNVISS